MLYLTRKEGEAVIINDCIEMTVMEIRGRSVKLGFLFPEDASVMRKELFERIKAQNLEASLAEIDENAFSVDISLERKDE